MIKATKNGFDGGLVKDPSALTQKRGSYTDALDIRVVTDHGGTGEAVINIEGNKHMTDIPDVPHIILLEPVFGDYSAVTWLAQVSVTINNTVITSDAVIGVDEGITVRKDAILELLNNDLAFQPYNLHVVSSGDRIRVWSDTANVTGYSDVGGFFTSTHQSQIPGVNQTIIGWVSSREVFYLWTTNHSSSVGGNGTLWAMSYNHDTYAATWDLIYSHDDMHMTTRHAIANPSAIEATYENSDYLRVAFTDFFNPLRILNVYDENLMAVLPIQFELDSGEAPRKPILETVNVGGALRTGTHQCAIRYRTGSGGYSHISPISNLVSVVDGLETGLFHDYEGGNSGIITSKLLRFKFLEVNTSYEFLEVLHIFRPTKFAAPEIAMVAELPANTAEMTYQITGNEDRVDLTLEDFINLDKPFTHCKTIAQKDNILFAGNTFNDRLDIEFDATAIRYDSTGATDGQHPDQDYFAFQSDLTTVGGTGVNVSYKIITKNIEADARGPNDVAYPHQIVNPSPNLPLDIGGDEHPSGFKYKYLGNPFLSGLVRGYKRGETYRFGLVFIKDGIEGRVHYIADIKMPWARSLGLSLAQRESFNLMNDATTYRFLRSIGLEFTVDISSVQNQIDGYRIVRVERTEADKTMLGGGVLSPMIHKSFSNDPGGGAFYLAASYAGSPKRPSDNHYYAINPNNNEETRQYTWHCPDYLFGKPFEHRPADQLVATEIYWSIDQTYTDTSPLGPHYNVDRIKLYNRDPISTVYPVTATGIRTVVDAAYCARGSQVEIDNITSNNLSVQGEGGGGLSGGGSSGTPYAKGTDTIMLKLTSNFLTGLTTTNATFLEFGGHVYCEYKRLNASQYGGISDTAKANNVYIDTGALMRVYEDTNSPTTMEVFGGDTFVSVFSSLKCYRNFDNDDDDHPETFGIMYYIPSESEINLDIRHGLRPNHESHFMDTIGATGHTPTQFEGEGEDFFYNYAYSAENNINVYVPEAITGPNNEEYQERIYASLPKVKGEIVDSWRDFRLSTMIDLEGNHGPINALINNSDSLFALQDRAFGKASINERATVSTTEGDATSLGTTGILSRFDYITTHSGSRHQFGIVNSPTSIYFFDATNGEFNRYSGGKLTPISSTKGIKAFLHDNTRGNWLFNNDAPIHYDQTNINQPGVYRGVTGTYDYRYDEVLLTFHISDESGDYAPFTLGYDEEANKFTSFYSFKPTVYLNDKFSIITPTPMDFSGRSTPGLYVHNEGERGRFYGLPGSRARIEVLVNESPEQSKIFTNMEWNSRVVTGQGVDIPLETISDIQLSTDYQYTPVNTDYKRRFRTWRHKVGRDVANGGRIRDHYARVLMTFQNEDDKKLILNDVVTIVDLTPM